MFCLLAVLLSVVLFYLIVKKDNDRVSALLLVIAVILGVIYLQNTKEGFNAPLSHRMPCGQVRLSGKDDIQRNMASTYDGLSLKSNPAPDYQLYDKVKIASPVGDDITLSQDPVSYNFNTITGDPNNGPRHMFMLSHNQCKPECCPGQGGYSCDHGCVCLNKKQTRFVSRRGGNASDYKYI